MIFSETKQYQMILHLSNNFYQSMKSIGDFDNILHQYLFF